MRRVRAARESGQSPSEEDRAKARSCFTQMGSAFQGGTRGGDGRGGQGGRGGAARGGNSRQRATTRPAVVFVPTANGPEPRQVVLGYSDLDFTEVISGLKAGDQVYLVTAARLLQQQRETTERMRERMQGPVPGMTGGPTPGRGR
jgi:hypothetical protein